MVLATAVRGAAGRLRDLSGAIEQFEQIVSLLPHHAESYFRLGALYNRTHAWSQAEAALRQALQRRPEFARAANSLAICLSHQGQTASAYAMFAHATDLQPSFAEAYYNWGLVLATEGDHVAAEMRYQHALQADADYVPAHRKLGALAVGAKDYTTALPHFQAVAQLRASSVDAQLNLAQLYHTMGKGLAARAQYEHVLSLQQATRRLNKLYSCCHNRRQWN